MTDIPNFALTQGYLQTLKKKNILLALPCSSSAK